jgi:MFS family permease
MNRKLLTRPLLMFMGGMILANIAGSMYQSLLPLYLQNLGAAVGDVGLFFTLSAIAPLLFQILGGWMSDSIGRLQAVAIGSLAGVLGYVVFLIAPTWHWLLLATATGALARAFVAPSYGAFISENSTEETRGQVFGMAEGLFMVVGVIGPPIGGFISEQYGFIAMFAVAGLFYSSATVVRIWMARGAHKAEKAADEKRERPTLSGLKSTLLTLAGMVLAGGIVTWIMITDGVRDVTYRLAFELLPLFMQNIAGMTNTQIGWLTAISSGVTMVFMAGGGWLSDKRGERVGIVGGFSLMVLALLLFILSRTFWMFSIAWALFGLGEALIGPAYNSLISKAVPQKLRGTAFGLFSTSLGVVSLPAPYLGGLLWENFGPHVPFFVPVVATLLLLPVMWIKFKLPKGQVTEEVVTPEAGIT